MKQRRCKTWWHCLAPGVFRNQHPDDSIAEIHRRVNRSAALVGQRPMTYGQVYYDCRKTAMESAR